MTNELTVIIQENKLEESKVESIMKNFSELFSDAKATAKFAKDIVVTSEDQVEEMEKARKTRLELKNIRVEADKRRKEMKEQSLREGRAIDGAFNIIKALVVPVEEYLEKQEKFAEILQAERFERIQAERIAELSKYVEDVSIYNLKEMSDQRFKDVLQDAKTAFENKKAADAKAEEERKAKEEADRLEQIKIREENERLKKEKEESDKKQAEEARVRAAKEQKEREERERAAEVERKKHEAELEKVRREKEAVEAQAKKERELQEKKELEEKQRVEAQKRLEEEERRKALLAPDKFKLIELAKAFLEIELPAVASKEAQDIIAEVERVRSDLNTFILNQATKL